MRNDRSVSIRVPQEMLDRVDSLRPLMAADPDVAVYGEPSRAALLRLAILRGLDQLEARYAPGWTIDVSGDSDSAPRAPATPAPEIVDAFGNTPGGEATTPLFDELAEDE